MQRNIRWFVIVTTLALASLLAVPCFAQQTTSASLKDEVALRAAMERETVQGDLKGAIERYQKIAESKDRAIAARALIRMAGAYQKLGAAEAWKIFERILKDYSDQAEAVARAKQELSVSTGKWQAEFPDVKVTLLSLFADGTRLSGTVQHGIDTVAIYDGKIEGDTIAFKVKASNGQRTITFNGKVNRDEIFFTRDLYVVDGAAAGGRGIFGIGGPPTFVAKRVKMTESR